MSQVAIRLPSRDNVAIVETLPDAATMEKFLFNDIGGTELINLVRNDSVAGINVNYTVLSDLATANMEMDPTEILIGRGRYDTSFDGYTIRLSTRIPETNYFDENPVTPDTNVGTSAYFDGDELIIEFDNMNQNEFIQVQIMTDVTIYTMRENDY